MSHNLLAKCSMVTRKPKEMPSDIAAEVSSADSLSFAGLVCIQDQYSKSQQGHDKPPPQQPKASKIRKQDPDFELVPSVHPFPKAIPFQTEQSQVLGHVSMQDILQPRSSGRRSSCNAIAHSGSAKKTKTEVRKITNKELSSGNKSLGKKFIQSIATPCRTCRAIEPSQSMEAHCAKRNGVSVTYRTCIFLSILRFGYLLS